MASQFCQCSKHKSSLNKVNRQSQVIWNRFCTCAKRCPGIKTADTGESSWLFLKKVNKKIVCFPLNLTKVNIHHFLVQIKQADSSTEHIPYPDSDDTVVFSFSSDESSDDEPELNFHTLTFVIHTQNSQYPLLSVKFGIEINGKFDISL